MKRRAQAPTTEQSEESPLSYCLDCEAWQQAAHYCPNARADARAWVENDNDDHG